MRMRKQNNKGMTLIEVLVAMAILAVLVTPTLRMFSTSSGTNLRAKYRQRATTVGESVMESFKAYTMEELCCQFTDKDFKGVNGTNDMTVNAHNLAPTVADPDAVSAPFNALLTNNTLNMNAQLYRFTIKGAKADGSSYDIQIDAKPRKDTKYGIDSLSFEGIDKYSDAIINMQETIVRSENGELSVFAVLSDLRDQAENSFTSSHGASYTFVDATIKNLKRTIDIDVEDTDLGSGKHSQTVTLAVTYTCKVNVRYNETIADGSIVTNKNWPATDGSGGTTEYTYKVEFNPSESGDAKYLCKIYDNSGTLAGQNVDGKNCKLNNVFLYYFPVNKEMYGEGCEDVINLKADLPKVLYDPDSDPDPKGKGLEPLNVVIAKQKPTTLTDGQITTNDPSYTYKVVGDISNGTENGKVNLYHNFNQPTIASSTPSWPAGRITGAFYNSTELNDTNVTTTSSTNLLKTFLTDDVYLIYDLDIKIYEDKTTGTFDRSELLAEFKGSKNE
ncbi:MAG: type II secretion system protein [Lachnospiraceae bacterium]|nr:type II secretion system protein [Lachnospiraceae bacterium]